MQRALLHALAIIGGLDLAGPAWANTVYTTDRLNVRAGPSTAFPILTTLNPEHGLFVEGCLPNFIWCDVSWRGGRGWVSANFLVIDTGEARETLASRLSWMPAASWDFESYWDTHYRSRYFYLQKSRYRSVRPR